MSQIHHYSIPAKNPRHVAEVLTGLFSGTLTGFGPYRDSFIVWFGDADGSAIEIYPADTEMYPASGYGQANFRSNPAVSGFSATHAAISIGRSREEILAVAQEHGWKALELSRGSFNVIEFWIENRILIELLTPDMTSDYREMAKQFMKQRI